MPALPPNTPTDTDKHLQRMADKLDTLATKLDTLASKLDTMSSKQDDQKTSTDQTNSILNAGITVSIG